MPTTLSGNCFGSLGSAADFRSEINHSGCRSLSRHGSARRRLKPASRSILRVIPPRYRPRVELPAKRDMHLTRRRGHEDLDRVAKKWTPQSKNVSAIRDEIAAMARKMSFTPLSGLTGEPLVNVLDLNRELDEKFPVPPLKGTP